MASYSITRRSELLRVQLHTKFPVIRGKRRIIFSQTIIPPITEQASLLLDGETGYLLQETGSKLLLDK